jgi:hypothetical protein
MIGRSHDSPLRLRSLDDVVDNLLKSRSPTVSFPAFGVFSFGTQAASLPEDSVVRLVDDLDVEDDLQLSPRGNRLLWIGAEANRDVDVVDFYRAANNGVGSRFGAFTNAEAATQVAPQQLEQLTLQLGRRSFILERQYRHRSDVRRQPTAGKAVADAAAAREREDG